MAIGDILSTTISPVGWQAHVLISGVTTGGFYNMGIGSTAFPYKPNTILFAPKVTFNVLSSGYDSTGGVVTRPRTIYGTTGLRQPYPNQDYRQETVDGINTLVKLCLSDYIYQADSSITMTALTGFYTAGGVGNIAISNQSVTNNSVQQYQKVVGNFSWPAYTQETGTGITLRGVFFHRDAQSGRQVVGVRYVINDVSGNYVTGHVSTPRVDSGVPDACRVVEYIASLPQATLSQKTQITGNFWAYPWIGDTGSVLTSDDRRFNQPTPMYSRRPMLCDKNQDYGRTVVVIDPVTGNNLAGQAVDITGFNINNPPPAFLTMHSGLRALASYNNTNRGGRNDAGAGIVYLKSGNHAYMGGTVTMATNVPTWINFEAYPNTLRSSVVITGRMGTSNASERAKFKGITFTGSVNDIFDSMDNVLIEDCYLASTASRLWVSCVNINIMHSTIGPVTLGLIPASNGDTTAVGLLRGNTFDGFNKGIMTFNVIGNKHISSGDSALYFNGTNGQTAAKPNVNCIIAFNKVMKHSNVAQLLTLGAIYSDTGVALCQNVFENYQHSVANAGLADIEASDTLATNFESKNIIVHNNTFVGNRVFMGYNDTTGKYKAFFSLKNNFYDIYANKTDIFGAGDGTRTGNWSINMGVGCAGNIDANTSGAVNGNVGGFPNSFDGLNCLRAEEGQGTGRNAPNWILFTNRQAHSTQPTYTGNGIYSYQSGTFATGFNRDLLFTHDIDGNERYIADAVGAYTFPLVIIGGGGGGGGGGIAIFNNGMIGYFGGRTSANGKNVLPRLYTP